MPDIGPESLSKEELYELRAAILYRENLRLQQQISDSDWRELQLRLRAKYGPGASFDATTGVVIRPAQSPEAA